MIDIEKIWDMKEKFPPVLKSQSHECQPLGSAVSIDSHKHTQSCYICHSEPGVASQAGESLAYVTDTP